MLILDYLAEEDVLPIEVKAGENTKSRSLGEYIRKYHHQGIFDLPLYDVYGIQKNLGDEHATNQ